MKANKNIIVKNTLFLYIRMFFTLLVTLYTSRIVLNVLGANDFGTYSVVGGIIGTFSFLSTTLASSTQRFLNYEMGSQNTGKLKDIFRTSLSIHLILSLIIILLAETLGLWFLNTQMNIPSERMYAANWVYQCSIASFVISIMSVPYNAAIIAHEKMSAFAYISILEVTLKLLVVFLLQWIGGDKLIIYAIMLMIAQLIVRLVYSRYAEIHFEECDNHYSINKTIMKEMLSFSSWNMISVFSVMLKNQGVNIILNIFFNTLVNAARGIAVQVNTVIYGFVTNFMQALNPQIVKNYAAGELKEVRSLVSLGARMGFYLISFFAIPILIKTEQILTLWLGEYPQYTIIFVRLTLILSMLESFGPTLAAAQAATGKIRNYHITISSIGLLNLPISILLLHWNYPPYIPYIVSISLMIIINGIRLYFLKKSIKIKVGNFITAVYLRGAVVVLTGTTIPLLIHKYYTNLHIIGLGIYMLLCFLSMGIAIFLIGLSSNERSIIIQKITRTIIKDKR